MLAVAVATAADVVLKPVAVKVRTTAAVDQPQNEMCSSESPWGKAICAVINVKLVQIKPLMKKNIIHIYNTILTYTYIYSMHHLYVVSGKIE